MAPNTDLKETEFFAVTMKTVGFSIDRNTTVKRDYSGQICELRRRSDHFRPLNNNSAFVLVAFMLSINFSIASIGGSAAIAFRNNCTRSHSSG